MKQTAERMMFKFENIFQVNQLQHNIQEWSSILGPAS